MIRVPYFSRLDEYSGVWCIEPTAFATQWETYSRMGPELAAHVLAAAERTRAEADTDTPKLRSEIQVAQAKNGRNVAIVPILGTMMKQRSSMGGASTIQARRDIRSAASNPDVSAILLAIESPGGTVAGTDDLAAEVKTARTKKPVWAHVDDLAASAAYWVASQAGQIFANSPTALVGSIGTFVAVYDSSAAATQAGVKVRLFATGPLKAAGFPGTELTSEQADYFQAIVDNSQSSFDRAVQAGRGLTARELAAVRTGGVFSARQAQELKLIDGIRSLDRTIEALAEAAGQRVSRGGDR